MGVIVNNWKSALCIMPNTKYRQTDRQKSILIFNFLILFGTSDKVYALAWWYV